jgi:hypothetical protein
MNRVNHGVSGRGVDRSACRGEYLDFFAARSFVLVERGVRPALGMLDLLVLRGCEST